MAAVNDPNNAMEEHCEECGQTTPHRVEIRLQVPSADDSPTAKFSRHPFRVARCRVCGEERYRRAGEA